MSCIEVALPLSDFFSVAEKLAVFQYHSLLLARFDMITGDDQSYPGCGVIF